MHNLKIIKCGENAKCDFCDKPAYFSIDMNQLDEYKHFISGYSIDLCPQCFAKLTNKFRQTLDDYLIK